MRARIAAITIVAGLLAVPSTHAKLLVHAKFPAAMAPLRGGGLVYGELTSGRIWKVSKKGHRGKHPIARIPHVASEGLRGLLGLAADRRGRVFADWTGTDGMILCRPGRARQAAGRLESRRRRRGGQRRPPGVRQGRPADRDRRRPRPLDPARAGRAPRPRVPRLQRRHLLAGPEPRPVTDTEDAGARVLQPVRARRDAVRRRVGDRQRDHPRHRPDRARPRRDGGAVRVHRTHGAVRLAAIDDHTLAVCGFVSRRLDRYAVAADGTAHLSGPPIAQDCTIGVIRLRDGRLAYASENRISVVKP